MKEKYEDRLWGQTEFLHMKSKRQQESLNYLIDLFTKFQENSAYFSKSLQSILSKGHELVESHSTSIYTSSLNFLTLYEEFSKQFKQISTNIKEKILEQFKGNYMDMFKKEKELLNSYNKAKSNYKSYKATMEKNRQSYESSMKICENAVFNSKHMDSLPYAGAEEKRKNASKATDTIKSAKSQEEKYKASLDNVNSARDLEIKLETELLAYYQKIDIKCCETLKESITMFSSYINTMNTQITKIVKVLDNSISKISIKDDILDYIKKNQNEKKVEEISKFIPYYPNADPIKPKNEKIEIDYEVLKTLKENFRDIRVDIDINKEKKKKRLRELSEKIFKFGTNISFSQEDKNELMQFLHTLEYREFFLSTLAKQRTKGRYKRSEILVKDLADLLLLILDLSEKIKDYETAKNCIILSQTYYYEVPSTKNKEEIVKMYLFKFISNNTWLNSKNFWDEIIGNMIDIEEKKLDENEGLKILKKGPEFKKDKMGQICFGQLITYIANMIEIGMCKSDVEEIGNKYIKKYELNEGLSNTIIEQIEVLYKEQAKKEGKIDNQEEKKEDKQEDKKEEIFEEEEKDVGEEEKVEEQKNVITNDKDKKEK